MNEFDWRVESFDDFITSIENGVQTNENTARVFFVKDGPIIGAREIYYGPAITSLDTNYLREIRDKLNFKMVMIFGGGGIEN